MSNPFRTDARVEELQEKVVKLEKDNRSLRDVRKQDIVLSVGAALLYAVMATIINVSINSFFAKSATEDRPRESRTERVHKALAAPPVKFWRYVRNVQDEVAYRECVKENNSRDNFLGLNELISDDFVYDRSGDEFIFCAMAGEQIAFRMKAILGSGIDSELTLMDDHGDELASDDDSGEGNDASLVFAFEKSGRYILQCDVDWMLFWNNHAGQYSLSARRVE